MDRVRARFLRDGRWLFLALPQCPAVPQSGRAGPAGRNWTIRPSALPSHVGWQPVHSRVRFLSGLSLGDLIAILAAIEALFGLLIEINFIATVTQRFFAR